MPELKLNLGSGPAKKAGYTNLDKCFGDEIFPLDYPDESVDEIRASHVLEHFSHTETMQVLEHWVKKLKPGGLLKIAVPDFGKITKMYDRGDEFNVQGFVMGGHSDENDHHGAIFDRECMYETFYKLGLERISNWESDAVDCATLSISLNLQAYKPCRPLQEDITEAGIHAILGAPRFGPVVHYRCITESLSRMAIPLTVVQGCFWHQNVSKAIENELSAGAKYILTLDYDSVFTPQEVLELYRLITFYPQADAIVPVQAKRHSDHPLFTMKDKDGNIRKEAYAEEFSGNLTRVYSGHFGLTIFKADAIRSFPKPWMNDAPNEEGRWEEGRLDADISWWKKWEEEGKSLYLAHKVRIGHMEELIVWPTDQFKPQYQTVSDFVKSGRPMEREQNVKS